MYRQPDIVGTQLGHMVSELNDARSPRVHEKWCVGQVSDDPPTCAQRTELDRHLLKGRLVGALVKYHDPPLSVATMTQALQVPVEPVAKVFECDLHRVLIRMRGLVNDARKARADS